MITNTLKLFFRCILQVFNVIFFVLLSFVLLFGCIIAFIPEYFKTMVHFGFFDNLHNIFDSFFKSFNISALKTSVDLFLKSFTQLFSSNIAISIICIILILAIVSVLFTWLNFSGNKRILEVLGQDEKIDENYLKIVKKLYLQSLIETVINILSNALILVFGYYLVSLFINIGMGNIWGYIFMLLYFIICYVAKKLLTCCWLHICIVKNISVKEAFVQSFEMTFESPFKLMFSCFVLVIVNLGLSVGLAQLNLTLLILSIAISYVLNNCFSAIVYNKKIKNKLHID